MKSTTLAFAALAALSGAVNTEKFQSADLYIDTPNTSELHSYELVKVAKNFHDAEQYCRSKQGHLASIKDKEENDIVNRIAGNNHVWLGGHDSGDKAWTWTDGTAFKYSFWQPGEPNDVGKGGEDCLGMYAGSGRWNDFSCSRHKLFSVCEYITKQTGKSHTVKSYRFQQTDTYSLQTGAVNQYHWYGPKNLPADPWKQLHSKPTVQVTLDWQDQCWGNQKGAFMLRLIRNGDPAGQDVKHLRVNRARRECRKTDRFNATNVQNNFIHGDTAQAWYYVGGGGGHKLAVHRATIDVAGQQ